MIVTSALSITQKLRSTNKITSLLVWLLVSLAMFSGHSVAQEREWWFDIEVIVYKQNIASNEISESFPQQLNLLNTQNWADPITKYLYPELSALHLAFPVCFATPQPELPLAEFSVPFEYPAYPPLSLELVIDNPDMELPLDQEEVDANASIEVNSAAVEVAVEPELIDTLRVLDDGSFFSNTHLSLWLESFSLVPIELPANPLCRYPEDSVPVIDVAKVPKRVHHKELPQARTTQLLSIDSMELAELANAIQRKRGLTTLLHTGWRQQVFFGEENATPMRIIAGQNFRTTFDAHGTAIPPSRLIESNNTVVDQSDYSEDGQAVNAPLSINQTGIETPIKIDLVSLIRQAITDDNFVFESNSALIQDELEDGALERLDLWEIDGSINVFLRYIQRTPYLHIDSNLDFRTPVFDNTITTPIAQTDNDLAKSNPSHLKSFPLTQLRRVISQQLHYFDHPMFGMIIQIRRFSFPEPPEEAEQDE
ncbi:peptidoglycan binding protein CsiV [Aliiglaciecola sp.]|nr:peptidoglycan binding protein CsiV [Aliiglaciecola sp.]